MITSLSPPGPDGAAPTASSEMSAQDRPSIQAPRQGSDPTPYSNIHTTAHLRKFWHSCGISTWAQSPYPRCTNNMHIACLNFWHHIFEHRLGCHHKLGCKLSPPPKEKQPYSSLCTYVTTTLICAPHNKLIITGSCRATLRPSLCPSEQSASHFLPPLASLMPLTIASVHCTRTSRH